MQTLTKIKPRFYSIASAHEMWPSDLQLTVGVLQVRCAVGSHDAVALRTSLCDLLRTSACCVRLAQRAVVLTSV